MLKMNLESGIDCMKYIIENESSEGLKEQLEQLDTDKLRKMYNQISSKRTAIKKNKEKLINMLIGVSLTHANMGRIFSENGELYK